MDLIKALKGLSKDRTAPWVALRGYWNDDSAGRAVLTAWVEGKTRCESPWASGLVAALWATAPKGQRTADGSVSFPVLLASLPRERKAGAVEGRFQALLDADRRGMELHVRDLVRVLDQEAPGRLDWGQLHRDLVELDSEDFDRSHAVRRRWSRAYWAS